MKRDPHVDWAEARRRFGQMLKRWRSLNGWAGQTAEDWQRSCPELLPFKIVNSVWTGLEIGRNERTAPATFRALGDLNIALTRTDRGVIRDRRLRDRVDTAQPIRHPDGRPWDHIDFYAAFWGEREIPEHLREPENMSPEEAEAWAEAWRAEFRRVQLRRSLRPRDAFQQVLREMSPPPSNDQVALMEDLAFGFAGIPPEEQQLITSAQSALERWGT